MEVVHVVLGKANPNRMNGVNKVVNELATRQSEAGMQVTLWGIAGNTIHDYPARIYATKLFLNTKNIFALRALLRDAIKSVAAGTVFHLHGGFVPQMYLVAKLLHKAGIPYVFTPHGSYNVIAMRKNSVVKNIYKALLEGSVVKRAMAIHLLGQSEVNGLTTWARHDNICTIPYGFEPEQAGERKNGVTEKFRIGFCGRIDVYTKGLDKLLAGFTIFHEKYRNSVLELIGDGGDMPLLKKIVAEYGLKDAVVLHGGKYGEEKIALIRQLDVFAHPSRNEGLPTAVLEAASLGIPCLVTQATNVGDTIAKYKAGLVIKDCNADDIAVALSALYENLNTDGRASVYSENAVAMIREAYNWQNLMQRYRLLYTRLAA